MSIDFKKYLTKQFWTELATEVILRVEKDTQQGIMQDDRSNIPYKSEQYKHYKANGMQRKTTGKADKNSMYVHNKKVKYTQKKPQGTGSRLKQYQGVQIISKETKFVNMTLTGSLWRNYMKGIKVFDDNTGVSISFAPQDADKVIGNQAQGRNIVGLNKKNTEFVHDRIIEALDKSLDEGWGKDITINIG